MTISINLEQFVGKEVRVTLRDGKIIVGFCMGIHTLTPIN